MSVTINGYTIGPFAYLPGASLHGARLSGEDLRGVGLPGANLGRAHLARADLREADLSRADLRHANLLYADLRYADLRNADLTGASLAGASLEGALLAGAKISDLLRAQLSVLPDEGDVTGWKKCQDGVIVKLLIRSGTRRGNATGRKCRAESAEVLEVIGAEAGVSMHDPKFTYTAGQTVSVPDFDPERFNECAPGIHFFITRAEAEDW